MKNKRGDDLKQYFQMLEVWKSEYLLPKTVSSIDQLAIIVLKIITELVDDEQAARTVAKELNLIIDLPERRCAEQDLMGAFAAIDQNLEENLRGFSGLMDFVLEEVHVRRDPEFLLKEIINVEPAIGDAFNQLTATIDAYLELSEAYSLYSSKAVTVVFLISLRDIFCLLVGRNFDHSQTIFSQWLRERIAKDPLTCLFDTANALIEKPWPKEEHVLTKDLVVVLLCHRAASGRTVTFDEISLLDRSLSSMGMLGIKPLMDAGFFLELVS